MDLIEKAARAMCVARGEDPDWEVVRGPPGVALHGHMLFGLRRRNWEFYAEMLRPALIALKPAHDWMRIRGRAVMPEHDEASQEDAQAVWEEMIEGLLEGDKTQETTT